MDLLLYLLLDEATNQDLVYMQFREDVTHRAEDLLTALRYNCRTAPIALRWVQHDAKGGRDILDKRQLHLRRRLSLPNGARATIQQPSKSTSKPRLRVLGTHTATQLVHAKGVGERATSLIMCSLY